MMRVLLFVVFSTFLTFSVSGQAVKTNALYDLTGTVNAGLEWKFGRKISVDVPVNVNLWSNGGYKKWEHILVQPGVRWWARDVFAGHFFGAHAHWAAFNVGRVPTSDYMRRSHFEGWLMGAGVSYGYRYNWKYNLALEGEVGLGYARLKYDRYECGWCGDFKGDGVDHYFGPTKVALNLVYTFGGQPDNYMVDRSAARQRRTALAEQRNVSNQRKEIQRDARRESLAEARREADRERRRDADLQRALERDRREAQIEDRRASIVEQKLSSRERREAQAGASRTALAEQKNTAREQRNAQKLAAQERRIALTEARRAAETERRANIEAQRLAAQQQRDAQLLVEQQRRETQLLLEQQRITEAEARRIEEQQRREAQALLEKQQREAEALSEANRRAALAEAQRRADEERANAQLLAEQERRLALIEAQRLAEQERANAQRVAEQERRTTELALLEARRVAEQERQAALAEQRLAEQQRRDALSKAEQERKIALAEQKVAEKQERFALADAQKQAAQERKVMLAEQKIAEKQKRVALADAQKQAAQERKVMLAEQKIAGKQRRDALRIAAQESKATLAAAVPVKEREGRGRKRGKSAAEPVLLVEANFTPSFVVPNPEPEKLRSESGNAYLDFPQGSAELRSGYRNNTAELYKIHALIESVRRDRSAAIAGISLTGYASPEGDFATNMTLSQDRVQATRNYLQGYTGLPGILITASAGGEDWAGLERLVEQSNMNYRREVLDIIRNTNDVDIREIRLAALGNGAAFKRMEEDMFPQLRRVEYSINYTVEPFTIEQGKRIIRTRPRTLSLDEMFQIACTYDPASAEYHEVFMIAAQTFSDSDIANLNAAASCLLQRDADKAAVYLERVREHTPAWWDNVGIVFWLRGDLERAAVSFTNAGTNGLDNAAALRKYMEAAK